MSDTMSPTEIDEFRARCRAFLDEHATGMNMGGDPDPRGSKRLEYGQIFQKALTEAGLAGLTYPKEYGGQGLTKEHERIWREEYGNYPNMTFEFTISHGMCLPMLAEYGTHEQKAAYLADNISGDKVWCQMFSEPGAGSDVASLQTKAERDGDTWRINGQKIWTSRAEHSDLMVLLARTTPADEVTNRMEGLSVFLVEMRDDAGELIPGLTINPIKTMMNHNSTEVFFDDVVIPATALIGTEGMGFRHILDGMNAERILIAAECIGDGRFFLDKASTYANEREVFGRPIGMNQGVAFPLAKAYANLEAANLMRWKAANLFDAGGSCAAEANMAKMLASEASWEAGNAAVQTFGGFGFAEEYDIERKLRETRLYQVAPINNNLVLAFVAQKCLGLPKSY